jgi:hypothetical protein
MKAAGVDDRVRTAAETIYQALIDAELTAVIGAGPWERSPDRTTQRNGYRPRILSATGPGIWSCGSRSCAKARSPPPCWSGAGGWTRSCSR